MIETETVAWFSAGISSFVAAYLSNPDRIVYVNVANQHPDTLRFIADAERILDRQIEIIGDQRYRQSVDEVIRRRRYINGAAGAACTTELKKRVRQEWERQNAHPGTVYVWGYDATERKRAERTRAASEFGVSFPLIERGLTKEDCHGIAAELGLKRPAMYDLGYANNNCIGCVKGGAVTGTRFAAISQKYLNKGRSRSARSGIAASRACFWMSLIRPQGV